MMPNAKTWIESLEVFFHSPEMTPAAQAVSTMVI